MRGKRKPLPLRRAAGRITPAYAGKTLLTKLQSFTLRDHPRVCGENGFLSAGLSRRGSPPRMRGKLDALSDGFDR